MASVRLSELASVGNEKISGHQLEVPTNVLNGTQTGHYLLTLIVNNLVAVLPELSVNITLKLREHPEHIN
jgi:hypothetical protein